MSRIIDVLRENKRLKTEYFEIVNKENLEPVSSFNNVENCIGCIAVHLGKVRLIDNIKFL